MDKFHLRTRTSLFDLLGSTPVEVLILTGIREPLHSAIWSSSRLQLVIQVLRPRHKPSLPPAGWSGTSFDVAHSDLGGLTDALFQVHLAQRDGSSIHFEWSHPFVSNTLRQILDPTLQGCKVPKATLDAASRNAPDGLLSWNQRYGWIHAPSVFSSDHWTKRHLSIKELANALDTPADALTAITSDDGHCLKQVAVPGKVLSQLIQCVHSNRGGDFATFVTPRDLHLKDDNDNKADDVLSVDETVITSNCSLLLPAIEQQQDITIGQIMESLNSTGLDLLCGDTSKVISAKATKADDSEVPEHLWNEAAIDGILWLKERLQEPGSRLLGFKLKRVFRLIRELLLKKWKAKVAGELTRWMEEYGPHLPDIPQANKIADQILKHVDAATWWNWDGGSTLFFWRWPLEYMEDALYGVKPMFEKGAKKPNYWTPQPSYKDPENKAKVFDKIKKVVDRGYLVPTPKADVSSLMFVFDVPKGDSDIRMVYDGSKSGLNDSVWAPWFPLPTAEAFFDVLMPGYWLSDNDMADFFLNFPMHPDLQRYCGVDVTQLFPEEAKGLEMFIVMWTRAAMGVTSSPHLTTMQAGISNRLILGHPEQMGNPFEWDRVILNLPGTTTYNCTRPWIYKIRKDGKLAADTKRFMDDLRNSAPTKQLAWEASTRIGKVTSWLGQQDAPRKRRPPSQTPGAWAATVVSTVDGMVMKFITQEAWNKAKLRVKYLAYYAGCDVSKDQVDFSLEKELKLKPKGVGFYIHKIAEKYRGYLIHIAATYEAIVPYLKGLHLTLDVWREGRDEEGWKDPVWFKFHRSDKEGYHQEKAPLHVEGVPRLKEDMKVLLEFFRDESPPKIPIRPTSFATMYIVGDASGTGYGNTSWGPEEDKIEGQYGGWEEEVQKESSNYREAYTALIGLEDKVKKGKLKKGCEVFIVTDNFITERVFENGSSKSKKLHELVVRLRRLQMLGYIFVRVIWVAGTRMILQGTDSLSRGDLCSGVMAGDPFLDHIPLAQSVLDIQPDLVPWFLKHLPRSWKLLEPQDWYHNAFESTEARFIWAPPPSIARQAIDCLADIHHIHPYSSHVILIPSIMTGKWRKRLSKSEPRGGLDGLIGWKNGTLTCVECCQKIVARQGVVCDNFGTTRSGARDPCVGAWHPKCYKKDPADGFPVLGARDLEDTIIDEDDFEDEDPFRFAEARAGDHLTCPFQCDSCVFWNLRGRNPIPNNTQDKFTLVCIRRVILDAFWARERSTVVYNSRQLSKYFEACDRLGDTDPLPPKGPWPTDDSFGFRLALATVVRSLDPGMYAKTIQFETVRKVRSAYSNYIHASVDGVGESFMADDSGVQSISRSTSNSHWFRRFMQGMHKRMGDIWIPDRAITIHEVLIAFTILEEDWETMTGAGDLAGMERAGLTAIIVISGFFGGFRGEEITRIDLGLIRKYWDEAMEAEDRHVPLMLNGRFKKETGEKVFCQPLAIVTNSGIKILLWFKRTLFALEKRGIFDGPLYRLRRPSGKLARATVGDLDVLFLSLWKRIQDRSPRTIPESVDVYDEFSISRSARRGATAHAQNVKVPREYIEANNRWRKYQRSRGSTPNMSMMERYSDAKASVPTLIRFSQSM